MKTFIKWPGNKTRYIKYIQKHIPSEYNRYIEPFIGSGALFLFLQPKKWLINDMNNDLITLWNIIKTNPKEIIKYVSNFTKKIIQLESSEKILYGKFLLKKMEKENDKIIRSAIYLFLTYCVFRGSLIRNGKYYFGSLDLTIYKNKLFIVNKNYNNNLYEINDYLNNSNGQIYNLDYKKILAKAKENDFIFLDPPYIEEKDNYQFNYNKDEKLDNTFIHELYNEVEKLDKKKVKWLMTQADTPEIRKIFKEYNISKFKVYRRFNLVHHKNELIIKNY